VKLKWQSWLYHLLQTTIGGAAASGSAWLGTLIGNQVDTNIPVLNWKQLGFVLLGSVATNVFFYLKQSPLPKVIPDVGDTDFIEKDK
jgi:hypothetical protein